MQESVLEKIRREYQPKTPVILKEDFNLIKAIKGNMSQSAANQQELKALFSNTYGMPVVKFEKGQSETAVKKMKAGVILSGGQAAGGHNVIAGIFDGLKKACADSQLYGFLNGPAGLIEGKYIEINEKMLSAYRNTGGFDIIGSGRTKIETSEQIASSIETAKKLGLDAIIIIGGDDSNTNAALLAEHFINAKLPTRVIGVPKTIDGDLKNDMIEVSFGFDTATKTYSELIGNIERDANSSKKYWHFIKLMGRSASHIALECALQTAPNICLISEEVEAKKMTLKQITSEIASVIVKRAENWDNFGVILIPEGLIEFIPDVKILISELNNLMAEHNNEFSQLKTFSAQTEWLANKLGKEEYNLFKMLPETIAEQLLLDRDPHGNVQVSRIETEKLLIELLTKELAQLRAEGKYKGKFSSYAHFFGYEGRSAFPSNFDADYCYSLGITAFLLAANGFTGYIAAIQNLTAAPEQWSAGGVPLTMMMNMEMRHGKEKPVIKKALVNLNGKPFQAWVKKREQAAVKTSFTYPGAIQYFGPDELCGRPTETLLLERKG